MSRTDSQSAVRSVTTARQHLPQLIHAAKDGHDILIGSRGRAEVRLTGDLGDDDTVRISRSDLTFLVHSLARAEATYMTNSAAIRRPPVEWMPSNRAGDILRWLIDDVGGFLPNDFILTLLVQLSSARREQDLPVISLDALLAGFALTMGATATRTELEARREELESMLRYLTPDNLDDLLAPRSNT